MRKLRVLFLVLEDFLPPDTIEGLSDKEIAPWKTEYDVKVSLEELGHDVIPVGVSDELGRIREAIRTHKPHIVFNLLEEFHGVGSYVPFVLGFLELMKQPYTGCNPTGLMVTENKALTKKILRYHRIRVPAFHVFPKRRAVKLPQKLSYPLIVKSATEHGSVGIAQASIVDDDSKLVDRVHFIHEQLGTDAIAEQYIDGRELYVGIMGNRRLQTFPVWELMFTKLTEGAPRIATQKVKWDLTYQKKIGLTTRAARDLDPALEDRIARMCKRVYRILGLSGYARLDLRLTEDGKAYVLEANPNPQLSYGDEFSEAAHKAGIQYNDLLNRILTLGLNYRAPWKG